MASDDEDVDLQALRSAVLASLKTKSKQVDKPKPKDEEDLESLRQAALQSKKAAETQELPYNRSFLKYHIGRRLPVNHLNHLRLPHSKFSWKRANNSNLITIQTVPLDSSVNECSEKLSSANKFHRPFRPQPHNHILTSKDEASSSPKVKQKSNDKFSRFESDSDSDDDSELNFPLSSSDSEDNISSTTADDTRTDAGTTTVDVSEVEDQNTMPGGSLGCRSSDKENEDSRSVCSDKEAVESEGDANLLTRNIKSEDLKCDGGDENHRQTIGSAEGAIHNNEQCINAQSENNCDLLLSNTVNADVVKMQLGSETPRQPEIKEAVGSDNTNCINLSEEEKLDHKQNGSCADLSPSSALSSCVTRDKLEARRRKFESQPIIQPKNTKISLRDIVQSVQENELNCLPPACEPANSPQATKRSSSPRSARDALSDSDCEGSSSSDDRQCKRLQMTRTKLPFSSATSNVTPVKLPCHQIALTDKEQDLRVSLRLKRQERLQQRPMDSMGSGWSSDESSSTDHCSSPVIKSVLSVVKVESRDSDRARDVSPSLRPQRTVNEDDTFNRRRLPSTTSGSRRQRNRRARTKSREVRRVNSKLSEDTISKDGRTQGASTSSATQKLPVRMRLGLPVTNSTALVEYKEAKKRRSASPSQTFSHVESKVRRQSSNSGRKEKAPKSSRKSSRREARVVRVAKKFSTTDSLESTGKVELACDGDLDQKIRRIQAKNEAIMRRQEEVNADRKKYS